MKEFNINAVGKEHINGCIIDLEMLLEERDSVTGDVLTAADQRKILIKLMHRLNVVWNDSNGIRAQDNPSLLEKEGESKRLKSMVVAAMEKLDAMPFSDPLTFEDYNEYVLDTLDDIGDPFNCCPK
jgi:hypothetical protein